MADGRIRRRLIKCLRRISKDLPLQRIKPGPWAIMPPSQTGELMKARIGRSLLLLGLCWGLATTVYAQAGQPDQPNMQAALRLLQQAQQRLESATQDKGGHRAQAIELTKRAIAETQAGMAFSNQHSVSGELLLFDEFLDSHTAVANDLRGNPNLINQEDYVINHPGLS